MRRWINKIVPGIALLLLAGPVGALSLSDFTVVPAPFIIRDFQAITDNNPNVAQTNAIGANLGVGFSYDSGLDLLLFQFVNVAQDGVIAEIYFDDDLGLLSTLAIYDESDPGVDFEINAVDTVNPGDLPGGGALGFSADTALSSEADNPAPTWGVGSGERLTLSFEGSTGVAVDDVVNVISAIETGQLRMGLHVISIGPYSESFVNNPGDPAPQGSQNPVPEPTTLVLLGMGSTFLLMRKRLAA